MRWEGRIVYNHLCYGDNPGGTRFIPILLPGAEPTHIPDPVRGHNHYQITAFDLSDAGFEALYRHLTDQPATLKPDLGALVILPQKPLPSPLGSKQSVGGVDDPTKTVKLVRMPRQDALWWCMGSVFGRPAMQNAGELVVTNISKYNIRIIGAKLRMPMEDCCVLPYEPNRHEVDIPWGCMVYFPFGFFVQPPVCENGSPFVTDVAVVDHFENEHWIERVEFQYNYGQIQPYNH